MARHVRRRQRSHLLHRMPDTICQLLARTAIRRYRRELGRYISETADRRRSRVTQGGIMIALIALLIITGGTGFLIWIARNKVERAEGVVLRDGEGTPIILLDGTTAETYRRVS